MAKGAAAVFACACLCARGKRRIDDGLCWRSRCGTCIQVRQAGASSESERLRGQVVGSRASGVVGGRIEGLAFAVLAHTPPSATAAAAVTGCGCHRCSAYWGARPL